MLRLRIYFPNKQLNKEYFMEKTQADAVSATMEVSRVEVRDIDISKPLEALFDDCLKFISVNDFQL